MTESAGPAGGEGADGAEEERHRGELPASLSAPAASVPVGGAAAEPPSTTESEAPAEFAASEGAEAAKSATAARIEKHLKAAAQQQGVLRGAEELLARVEELVDPALRPSLQSTAHTLQRAREAFDAVHHTAADGSLDAVSRRVSDLKVRPVGRPRRTRPSSQGLRADRRGGRPQTRGHGGPGGAKRRDPARERSAGRGPGAERAAHCSGAPSTPPGLASGGPWPRPAAGNGRVRGGLSAPRVVSLSCTSRFAHSLAGKGAGGSQCWAAH